MANGSRTFLHGRVLTSQILLETGENYAGGIARRIGLLSGGKLTVVDGTIIHELHKMLKDGLVEFLREEKNKGRGGLYKKYYRLTELGKQKAIENREIIRNIFRFPHIHLNSNP